MKNDSIIDDLIREPPVLWDDVLIPRIPNATEKKLGLWIDRYGYNIYGVTCPNRIMQLYSIIYVFDGNTSFYSEISGKHKLIKGDVFCTFPGVPHAFATTNPNPPWVRCSIMFNGTFAKKLEALGFLSRTSPVKHDGNGVIYELYKKLKANQYIDTVDSALWRMNNLIHAISILNKKQPTSQLNIYTQDKLSEILLYISKHLTDGIVPAELAKRFNVSYSHLRRIFKEKTGSSIKEYINKQKITIAKNLLNESSLSINEIAYECGFNDEYYFMRVFKKITGTTPTRYREYSI